MNLRTAQPARFERIKAAYQAWNAEMLPLLPPRA